MPLARSENGLSGEIRLDDVDYRRIVYDMFATGLGATSFEPTCGETKINLTRFWTTQGACSRSIPGALRAT